MASKHVPAKGSSPPGADNFKLVKNIRRAVEQRLHRAGILTYAQLAELSPEAIAALVAGVRGPSAEDIDREDWIGQAQKLAEARVAHTAPPPLEPESAPPSEPAEAASATAQPAAPAAPGEPGAAARSPTATGATVRLAVPADEDRAAQEDVYRDVRFQIRLLIDERQHVHDTTIQEVEKGGFDKWPGWDTDRLLAFIEQWADLRLESSEPTTERPQPAALATVPAAPVLPAPPPAKEEPAAPPAPPPVPAGPALRGVLHVRRIETGIVGSPGSEYMLRQGQLLRQRLTLDFGEVVAPPGASLSYKAIVYARQIGSPRRVTIAERTGNIRIGAPVQIELSGRSLPPGFYRLIATVSLATADQPDRPQLVAFLESGLVHVL